jgi:hypothetical protein
MNRLGSAVISLRLGRCRSIVFEEALEVSLDCPVCSRRSRTVFFSGPGQPGRCSSDHGFGTLLAVTQSGSSAKYEFEYAYEPFVDAKYPDERRYAAEIKGSPTWVRAYFNVVCSSCGRSEKRSTQTNLVRPFAYPCRCGAILFEDVDTPELDWSEASG